MTHGEPCGDTWQAMCQHAWHTFKVINMGIKFNSRAVQFVGAARRRRRKGEEKGRKRKEKERRKEDKKKEEERKKKEEKEGVSCSEETQTTKNLELRYER